MGILNVTPDSFSDGGQFADAPAAAAQGMELLAGGADILDIGGESTRPGSQSVPACEQIRRVAPVIRLIREASAAPMSVDTTRWEVAAAAIEAGVNVVNDVSAGRDDSAMLPGVARAGVPIILMHMRGVPRTMQENPSYGDVTGEVIEFLMERGDAAVSAGINPSRILLDPGLGFGKTADHNLTLLRDLPRLAELGRPLVIGASRKSFIGKILGQSDPQKRIFGDAAVISWSIANGAAVLRVHDVGPMAQVAKMTRAIRYGEFKNDPA
jgi:dihydropteroate synthase